MTKTQKRKAEATPKKKKPQPSAWSRQLVHIDEPLLEFAHEQRAEHPRDGLYLYGPLSEQGGPLPLDYGVIGTKDGVAMLCRWAEKVCKPIARFVPPKNPYALHHITFPGFEAAFNTRWPTQPVARILVDPTAIDQTIRIGNRAEAIKGTVDLFVKPLIDHGNTEEKDPKFWFVVLPEIVFKFGRPNQQVPKAEQTKGTVTLTRKRAKELEIEPSLFDEGDDAEIYKYGLDFRRQLKARLLEPKIVTQLVRETTIAPDDFKTPTGRLVRTVE
jgi:hypothetical protein